MLKVEIRFPVFHDNGSNIEWCVVEIHQWWKLWLLHIVIGPKFMHYFTYGSEILLSTRERNLEHT